MIVFNSIKSKMLSESMKSTRRLPLALEQRLS